MANVIRVSVENADELLNAGAYDALAIVRLQSSATETGSYTNEATATLVAAWNAVAIISADHARPVGRAVHHLPRGD